MHNNLQFTENNNNPIKQIGSLYETNIPNILETKELMHYNNLTFNYYSIPCNNITRNANKIHCIYRGIENKPNIIYNKQTIFPNYFQCTDLYIYPYLDGYKNHIYDTLPINSLNIKKKTIGSIIIKHSPISNTTQEIYTCFLLSNENSIKTELDIILTSRYQDEYIELNIQEHIERNIAQSSKSSQSSKWNFYETTDLYGKKCIFILFFEPICINSPISKWNISSTSYKNSCKILNSIEGFVKMTNNDAKIGYALDKDTDNEMICEVIPDDGSNVLMYQEPVLGTTSNVKNNLDFILITIYTILVFINIGVIYSLTPLIYRWLMALDIKFLNDFLKSMNPIWGDWSTIGFILTFIFIFISILLVAIGLIIILNKKETLDPNQNGFYKTFDPNQNGLANTFNNTFYPNKKDIVKSETFINKKEGFDVNDIQELNTSSPGYILILTGILVFFETAIVLICTKIRNANKELTISTTTDESA
jgi:hypothetical protein